LSELAKKFEAAEPRGEVTLLVAPPDDDTNAEIDALKPVILNARKDGESPSRAAQRLSKQFGLPRSLVYGILIENDEQ